MKRYGDRPFETLKGFTSSIQEMAVSFSLHFTLRSLFTSLCNVTSYTGTRVLDKMSTLTQFLQFIKLLSWVFKSFLKFSDVEVVINHSFVSKWPTSSLSMITLVHLTKTPNQFLQHRDCCAGQLFHLAVIPIVPRLRQLHWM